MGSDKAMEHTRVLLHVPKYHRTYFAFWGSCVNRKCQILKHSVKTVKEIDTFDGVQPDP